MPSCFVLNEQYFLFALLTSSISFCRSLSSLLLLSLVGRPLLGSVSSVLPALCLEIHLLTAAWLQPSRFEICCCFFPYCFNFMINSLCCFVSISIIKTELVFITYFCRSLKKGVVAKLKVAINS